MITPFGEGIDWGKNINKPMISSSKPWSTDRRCWESFNYISNETYDTNFMSYSPGGAITFYNPNPIQLKNVTFKRAATQGSSGLNGYLIKVIYLYGSNDNSTWVELGNNFNAPWHDYKANATYEFSIDNSDYFKYIKIVGHRDTTAYSYTSDVCEFGSIYLNGIEYKVVDEKLDKIFTIGEQSDKNIKVLNIEQAEKFN